MTKTKLILAGVALWLLSRSKSASSPASADGGVTIDEQLVDAYEYNGTYRKMVCGKSVEVTQAEYDELVAANYHDTCGAVATTVIDTAQSWAGQVGQFLSGGKA
jgi:hypothetical protein